MDFRIILNVSVNGCGGKKKGKKKWNFPRNMIFLYCLNYNQLSTIHSACQLRHTRGWVLRLYQFDRTLKHNSNSNLEVNISGTNLIKKYISFLWYTRESTSYSVCFTGTSFLVNPEISSKYPRRIICTVKIQQSVKELELNIEKKKIKREMGECLLWFSSFTEIWRKQ